MSVMILPKLIGYPKEGPKRKCEEQNDFHWLGERWGGGSADHNPPRRFVLHASGSRHPWSTLLLVISYSSAIYIYFFFWIDHNVLHKANQAVTEFPPKLSQSTTMWSENIVMSSFKGFKVVVSVETPTSEKSSRVLASGRPFGHRYPFFEMEQ